MGAGARRLPRRSGPRPGAGQLDAALALRQLLNPVRRSALTGLARRHLIVVAVWPDGPGFAARLESPRRPGIPVVWVRWRDGYEIWPFPEDPELPALADLMDEGHTLLGHRLGSRATLLAPGESEVIYLRSPRSASTVIPRLLAVHEALEKAGVAAVRVKETSRELSALRVEVVERNGVQGDASWSALGERLARVHGQVVPPSGLPPRGPGPALDATVRQVGMAFHAGDAFTQWLERRLERWHLLGLAGRAPGRALVHGDLHPAQIIWSSVPVFLDWDRAGPGDPEEDLGDLAAHLYWMSPTEAAGHFAVLKRAYVGAGGRVNQPMFEQYARLSLVRVLAVYALREPAHALLHGQQARWADWPDVVSAW